MPVSETGRRKLVSVSALTLFLALAAACSGNNSAASQSTSAPATPTGASAVATASPAAVSTAQVAPAALSLVYLDESKGGGRADLYRAALDGGKPSLVTSFTQVPQFLDMHGKTLALLSGADLILVDLTGAASPATIPVPALAPGPPPVVANRVHGRFLDDRTFIFTAARACAGGPSGATLFKLDTGKLSDGAGAVTKLADITSDMEIIGMDSASGIVALTPRGCAVDIGLTNLYSLVDGKLLSSTETPGCSWAVASPALKKAIVAWRSCNEPGTQHAGVQLTAYDLAGGKPPGHNFKGPDGSAVTQTGVLSPDQRLLAIATSSAATTSGTSTTSKLWLVNLSDLTFKALSPGAGADEAPVAWSPDGRHLLGRSTVAQGRCEYFYVDTATGEVHPVNRDITWCGTEGEVLGWSALP